MAGQPDAMEAKRLVCSKCGSENPAWRTTCEKCKASLFNTFAGASSQPIAAGAQPKLTVLGHILCGWPLALVLFGGAIGGALGGAAYVINTAIYKADMPTILKIVLNLVTGLSAIGLWVVIRVALTG